MDCFTFLRKERFINTNGEMSYKSPEGGKYRPLSDTQQDYSHPVKLNIPHHSIFVK